MGVRSESGPCNNCWSSMLASTASMRACSNSAGDPSGRTLRGAFSSNEGCGSSFSRIYVLIFSVFAEIIFESSRILDEAIFAIICRLVIGSNSSFRLLHSNFGSRLEVLMFISLYSGCHQ